jgi:hypothetical protein
MGVIGSPFEPALKSLGREPEGPRLEVTGDEEGIVEAAEVDKGLDVEKKRMGILAVEREAAKTRVETNCID